MPEQLRSSYSPQARQRLYRILVNLIASRTVLNWKSMADRISEFRGIEFPRLYFYRLRDNVLGSQSVEYIVEWLEAKIDAGIRVRLETNAVFDEFGRINLEYYFHIPPSNDLEEWQTQILDEYAGVYLCAPANDKNTFLPLPTLRRWFESGGTDPAFERKHRSIDIKQYINERSILILQKTSESYFYAAEFPYSLLLPRDFVTLDYRMVYEGIGIVAANSIQVQLRECLARVPKTHSILINTKTATHNANPLGLSLYLPPGTEGVKKEWLELSTEEISHLKTENGSVIDDETYLSGPAQISLSPLPNLNNHVGSNFSNNLVYLRRPSDLFQNLDAFFLRPDLDVAEQIEKIIANPLFIGEIL